MRLNRLVRKCFRIELKKVPHRENLMLRRAER